jgi:hypothetical protein
MECKKDVSKLITGINEIQKQIKNEKNRVKWDFGLINDLIFKRL